MWWKIDSIWLKIERVMIFPHFSAFTMISATSTECSVVSVEQRKLRELCQYNVYPVVLAYWTLIKLQTKLSWAILWNVFMNEEEIFLVASSSRTWWDHSWWLFWEGDWIVLRYITGQEFGNPLGDPGVPLVWGSCGESKLDFWLLEGV